MISSSFLMRLCWVDQVQDQEEVPDAWSWECYILSRYEHRKQSGWGNDRLRAAQLHSGNLCAVQNGGVQATCIANGNETWQEETQPRSILSAQIPIDDWKHDVCDDCHWARYRRCHCSSQPVQSQSEQCASAIIHVFQYHKGTRDWGQRFGWALKVAIAHGCYVNSDYAGCPDDYELASGQGNYFAGAIDWWPRNRKSHPLSTTNAEYDAFRVRCLRPTHILHFLT